MEHEAVRLVREGSKSLPQVAKDLDLTESALRNWVREADEGEGKGRRARSPRPSSSAVHGPPPRWPRAPPPCAPPTPPARGARATAACAPPPPPPTPGAPGLTPGLRVLVLGVCGSKETALAARARVLPMVTDAYVKQLSGPAPLACPTPIPLKARLPKGAVQLASVPFKQDKTLVLSVYKVNARSVMECETNDLLFRLEYGREVLTERTHTGECTGVCTPEGQREGEAKIAAIEKRIENEEGSTSELDYNFASCISLTPEFLGVLGGYERPLFFMSSTSLAHHDVPRRTVHPVGVACGEITGSAYSDESGPYSDPVKHFTHAEARRSTKEDADEHTFDIGVREQAPDAADGGPPVWKTVATLTDDGCGLELSVGER